MDGSDAKTGFDYPELMRAALLDVVRRLLTHAAEQGLPGEHHFYLTFGTGDEGVLISPALRLQYPEEMTIVLQHQYWSLAVDDAGFGVSLRFAGRMERLVVPWAALRAFADPSADFGFRLQPPAGEAAAATDAPAPEAEPEATASEPAQGPTPVEDAVSGSAERTTERGADNVVDFGAFRRRSDN
jgi:uncharacterized protein